MLNLRRLPLYIAFLGLAACAANDLSDPPPDLGEFVLGHNIVVADNMQKVPISRDATADEWEAAMKKAMTDRFGRYEGSRIYNIGVSVDAYALAPPGIPLVLAPKSIVVVTANIWDDAQQKRLSPEGKQFTVFENLDGDSVVGSGLTKTREQQMASLSFNAAKAIERWLVDNPEWFGLSAKRRKPPVPTRMSAPAADDAAEDGAKAGEETVAAEDGDIRK